MTISKKCENLAGDYLFLRDNLLGLQNNITKLENKEKIHSLANNFILTFLEPPGCDIMYPNIPERTLVRVVQGIRGALEEPLDRIPLTLNASTAELQDEMWQEVVACECEKRK